MVCNQPNQLSQSGLLCSQRGIKALLRTFALRSPKVNSLCTDLGGLSWRQNKVSMCELRLLRSFLMGCFVEAQCLPVFSLSFAFK